MAYITAKKLGKKNNSNKIYNLDLTWLKSDEIDLFLKVSEFAKKLNKVNMQTAMVHANGSIEATAKEFNLTKNEALHQYVKALKL